MYQFTPTLAQKSIMAVMIEFLKSDIGWAYKSITLTLTHQDSHYCCEFSYPATTQVCELGKCYMIDFVKENEPSFKLNKPLKVKFIEEKS